MLISSCFLTFEVKLWNCLWHCLLLPWPLEPMLKLDLAPPSVQELHGEPALQIPLGWALNHQPTSLFITPPEPVARPKPLAMEKWDQFKICTWTATDGPILATISALEIPESFMKVVAGTALVLTPQASTPARLDSALWVTSWPFSHPQPLWTTLKPSSFAQEIGDVSQPPTDWWVTDKMLPLLVPETLCSETSKDGQDGLNF